MERGHSAKGRKAVKAWDPAAAANAAAGAVEEAKGGTREARGAARDAARAPTLARRRGRQKPPAQPTRLTKKNQSHKRNETIMPGGNQTGPMGQGPKTGRASGYCAGFNQSGWMNRMVGRWFGRGGGGQGGGQGGGGWGRRHWFHATGLTGWQRAAMRVSAWGGSGPLPTADADHPAATQEQELVSLKQQASQLEAGLEQIRNRIEELSKAAAK